VSDQLDLKSQKQPKKHFFQIPGLDEQAETQISKTAPAHGEPLREQRLDEVAADKSPGACHDCIDSLHG